MQATGMCLTKARRSLGPKPSKHARVAVSSTRRLQHEARHLNDALGALQGIRQMKHETEWMYQFEIEAQDPGKHRSLC